MKFKTNTHNGFIQPQFIVKNDNENYAYNGINEFSSAGMGYEKDNSILNMVSRFDDSATTKEFVKNFDEVWNDEKLLKDVTDEVVSYISDLYKENSPEFIYYITLYNIFDEFLGKTIQYLTLKEDKRRFRISSDKNIFNFCICHSQL